MNELTTLAKFIYSTAVQDTAYFSLCNNRFREEIIPIGVKVTQPTAMFVGASNKDIKGAFGYRLFTKSVYQIKAVAEGSDFKVLAPVAHAIDRLFDWQNQIDPAAGRPVSQKIFIDPDDSTLQIIVMCMIRNKPIKYCDFSDGVNYCHLGGEYLIEHYYINPPLSTVPNDMINSTTLNTSGTVIKPVYAEYTFFLDTSTQALNLVLFAATGSLNKYDFINTGPNDATVILAPNDTVNGTQTSFLVPGYGAKTLIDHLTQKWSITMAYEPGSPTGTVPTINITATTTLTMPTQDTRYPVNITANTVITLPAANGNGRKLYFDFDSLGAFTCGFTLNGSDTYVTPLPPVVTGATFALVSDASGKWSIE